MIRPMRAEDMGAVTILRISVKENHLSVEDMAERGITPQGIIADLDAGKLGAWVAEEQGTIVAFSMADQSTGQIFALFTMPGHERKGYGAALLDEALIWLKARGHREARLSTARNSTAHRFYERRGWIVTGNDPDDSEDVMLRRQLV